MKKYYLFLTALLYMVGLSSCSDRSNNLLDAIPSDIDGVCVFNPVDLVRVVGGSVDQTGIHLPTTITGEYDTEVVDDLNALLAGNAVDREQIAFIYRYGDLNDLLLLSVTDKDQLAKNAQKAGYEHASNVTSCQLYTKRLSGDVNRYSYLAVNGDIAYLQLATQAGSMDYVDELTKLILAANKASFASTQYSEYVYRGKTFGALVRTSDVLDRTDVPELSDIGSGLVCMWGETSDKKIDIAAKCFNDNGQPIDFGTLSEVMNTSAKISKNALSYLSPDQTILFAVALEDVDWNKLLGLIAAMPGNASNGKIAMLKNYLEKINGTVAIGLNLPSQTPVSESLDKISATLVIETRTGEAKNLIRDMQMYLPMLRVPVMSTVDGLKVVLGEININIEAHENTLVISTGPVSTSSGNTTIDGKTITDYLMALSVVLSPDFSILQNLGMTNGASLLLVPDFDNSELLVTIRPN